jgi:hypothetical protein
MATPTDKAPELDKLLSEILGVDRRATIAADKCVSCKRDAMAFKNELSKKEYSISGLCQKCQDEIWK